MLHILSLVLFSTVLVGSIGIIAATIRAELPLIMQVLGVDAQQAPPIRPEGERRTARIVRLSRPAWEQMVPQQRFAA